ncbi:MAG: dipeptide/oligopeptide/nickel ABC transporter ATP-binding protein [Firmicutes bacterium HGW-Firmicutes-21]|nr:MAG: dipeptide/oligopeptide/nickel ABC transporter ATP-binding protein [Firmicutes bacterium HGW-Firmicutes-21]
MSNDNNKNPYTLTRKEERAINKNNRKAMKLFEDIKKQKHVSESEYMSQMKNRNNVIEFDNLHTYFYTDTGTVKAVNGVSFEIPSGSTVGVVGESGCGKSVTALSLMQLVQAPQGQIAKGAIRYNAGDKCYDVVKMPTEAMRKIRGNDITMIFQEPMTSLNPVLTVGSQIDEVILLHLEGYTAKKAAEKSVEMLRAVGIARPEEVYGSYAHELSGGMRQRVMIAMALACKPKLIIADEPTTALDVTIQAQILDLLREVKRNTLSSIMLITHDLGVVAETADYVVVMYAGRIVEKGTVREIFMQPKHPYTVGLMRSKPSVSKTSDRLYSIPGQVPNPINMPDCCYFRDRCEKRSDKCDGTYPKPISFSDTHNTACYLYEDCGEVR